MNTVEVSRSEIKGGSTKGNFVPLITEESSRGAIALCTGKRIKLGISRIGFSLGLHGCFERHIDVEPHGLEAIEVMTKTMKMLKVPKMQPLI
eukprot:scaffold2291_cov363-Pavlova_lutheri.AAC.1